QKDSNMATATTNKTDSDFEVTTQAPAFIRGRGRAKSPLRIAIEDLEVGQFLKVGKSNKKLENSTRSMVSAVTDRAERDGKEVVYSVRHDADDFLWVERRK